MKKSKPEDNGWKTETTAVPFETIAKEIDSLEPMKRRPGRPKKNAENAGAISTSSSQKSPSGSLSPSGMIDQAQGASSGATNAFLPISSGIPLEIIRNGLEMPFAIAAASTGFSGFALSKDESDPLVPQADHLIAKYMPEMGPNGALYMFSFSLLALAAVKYMGYQDFKKSKNVSSENRVRKEENSL